MTELLTPQPSESAPPSAGALLKAAREAKGLTINQVAEQLKLYPRQIAALETEDFSSLPGNTFVRGFVRNYARHLGLDPQLLLEHLSLVLPQERIQIAMPPVGEATAYERGVELGGSSTPWLVWVFVVMGLLLGAGGVFWYLQKPTTPDMALSDSPVSQETVSLGIASAPVMVFSQTASVPVVVDVPPPPALEASPVAASSNAVSDMPAGEAIKIVATEASSWVQVSDADGRVLISQLVAPNGERGAAGKPPFRVKIGNAPKTKLYYRGQPVDLTPHIRGDVATLELK